MKMEKQTRGHGRAWSLGHGTWRLSVAISLGAMLLTACGGDDGSPVLPAASSSTSSSAPVLAADKAYFDPVAYGNRADDSISDTNEDGAVTHHVVTINGQSIQYTATAGHLVTTDPGSSQPNAKLFYVAYTADGKAPSTRPVTFFYNGGPGSAAVWLLLGSYAPKRIKTSLPDFTPPAPYTIETNPDSLLDKTDLVFINPVGTGYSTAIAPAKNKDFWGVDQDAVSLKQFIKRYLTANQRWNSPKFLYGESYGTPRTAVLANALHGDGVDLNGIVLQSSILDFRQGDNPVGLLPTYAADAWYHKKATDASASADLPSFMNSASQFASNEYAKSAASEIERWARIKTAKDDPDLSDAEDAAFAKAGSPSTLTWTSIADYIKTLPNSASLMTKLDAYFKARGYDYDIELTPAIQDAIAKAANPNTLTWGQVRTYLATLPNGPNLVAKLDIRLADQNRPEPDDGIITQVSGFIGMSPAVLKDNRLLVDTDTFQRSLVADRSIGAYDGRATTTNLGVAADISLVNNDAFDRATTGVYIAAWNAYLNEELKYTSNSTFTGITSVSWDYTHKDPTGKTSRGRGNLNTVTDLAAIMSLNPDLKVFQASGYYDDVTPWYQTRIDLQNMNLDPALRKNLQIKEYPSGHMIYLDPDSRTALRSDLLQFFQSVGSDQAAMRRIMRLQQNSSS